jgi:hypothetical protein
MLEPCAVKVACTVLRGEGFWQQTPPTLHALTPKNNP